MRKVLIVDDEPAIRQLIRIILEEEGYAVTEARDGKEGLARSAEADLILTDIVMPENEGVELIRNCRKDRPQLPIIAMSGALFGSNYLTIASHLGAHCTLTKPISRDHLLAAVTRALPAAGGDYLESRM